MKRHNIIVESTPGNLRAVVSSLPSYSMASSDWYPQVNSLARTACFLRAILACSLLKQKSRHLRITIPNMEADRGLWEVVVWLP